MGQTSSRNKQSRYLAYPDPIVENGSIRPQDFRADRNPRKNDKFIAIMGVMGSGKSSFIKLLTDAKVEIGMGLEACTSKVDVYPMQLHPDQTIYLVDTPGFNDTYKSDSQILIDITSWLSNSYSNNVHLNGVIYLHDITQGRMYGSSLKTLKMFKELSGKDAMKKVILATTHWDTVHPDHMAQTEAREQQLIQKDEFWGSMIAKGSRVERHNNTKSSAERLVRLIVPQKPVTLAVQTQMVDQKLKLSETAAGKTLSMGMVKKMDELYHQQVEELRFNKRQSEEMRKKYERELENMRKKLEITSREMTERMNRELESREARLRKQAEAQAEREEQFRQEQKEAYKRRQKALRRDLERERQWLREQQSKSADADNHIQVLHATNPDSSHNTTSPGYNPIRKNMNMAVPVHQRPQADGLQSGQYFSHRNNRSGVSIVVAPNISPNISPNINNSNSNGVTWT